MRAGYLQKRTQGGDVSQVLGSTSPKFSPSSPTGAFPPASLSYSPVSEKGEEIIVVPPRSKVERNENPIPASRTTSSYTSGPRVLDSKNYMDTYENPPQVLDLPCPPQILLTRLVLLPFKLPRATIIHLPPRVLLTSADLHPLYPGSFSGPPQPHSHPRREARLAFLIYRKPSYRSRRIAEECE